MAERQIVTTRMICDRCGATEDSGGDRPAQKIRPIEWVRLSMEGRHVPIEMQGKKDLCPDCFPAFAAFLKGSKQ